MLQYDNSMNFKGANSHLKLPKVLPENDSNLHAILEKQWRNRLVTITNDRQWCKQRGLGKKRDGVNQLIKHILFALLVLYFLWL